MNDAKIVNEKWETKTKEREKWKKIFSIDTVDKKIIHSFAFSCAMFSI